MLAGLASNREINLSSPTAILHPGSPIRVLIVDDIANVRHDLGQLLQLSGGLDIVGEAGNGLEAVQKAACIHTDVVLMDLEMPVMDGYQASHLIKELLPDCRIVGLSIHSTTEAGEKARQAGIDMYVEKSSSVQAILMAVMSERSK